MLPILPLLLLAASAGAAEIKLDFDGDNTPGLTAGQGIPAKTLGTLLAESAAESSLPQARWGEIPPANGPSCVDSPYGCPGTGGGGSSGGQEPVPPAYYSGIQGIFPAAVYVNTGLNNPAPTLMTGDQAATKLGTVLVKNIFMTDITEKLKLKFPYQMSRVEAIKAMAELEMETIKRVKAQLSKDLQSMIPMPWESAEEQARKLAIIRSDEAAINVWWGAARNEALGGGNWTETSQMTFTFSGGPAYLQLGKSLQCRNCFRSRIPGSLFEELLKD